MPKIDTEKMKSKQKEEKHVCIRIFKDDSVQVTDQDGTLIEPVKNPKPIVGPKNTYAQALWYNENPTCVWINGKQY